MYQQSGLDRIKLKAIDKWLTIYANGKAIVKETPYAEVDFETIVALNEPLKFEIYTEHKLSKKLTLKETIEYQHEAQVKPTQPNQPTLNPKKEMSDNTAMLNLMISQKDREISKLENQNDRLIDDIRKLREKIEILTSANNQLTVDLKTADKEKELALLLEKSVHSQGINGIVESIQKPEMLSGLAALVSAFKGNATSTPTNDVFSRMSSQEHKDSLQVIIEKLEKIDKGVAVQLATIINTMGENEISVAYNHIVEALQNKANQNLSN